MTLWKAKCPPTTVGGSSWATMNHMVDVITCSLHVPKSKITYLRLDPLWFLILKLYLVNLGFLSQTSKFNFGTGSSQRDSLKYLKFKYGHVLQIWYHSLLRDSRDVFSWSAHQCKAPRHRTFRLMAVWFSTQITWTEQFINLENPVLKHKSGLEGVKMQSICFFCHASHAVAAHQYVHTCT